MNLLESEKEGVTVYWKMEDFNLDSNWRFLQHRVAAFPFPATNESEWILEFVLTGQRDNDFYAYLTKCSDEQKSSILLSCTFSVVASDNTFHALGGFIDQIVESGDVKEVPLKKLCDIPRDEKELLPEQVLTLRCHIWNCSATETVYSIPTQYYFRSRSLVQKSLFLWVIKGHMDDKTQTWDFDWKYRYKLFEYGCSGFQIAVRYPLVFTEKKLRIIAKKLGGKSLSCFTSKLWVLCANGTSVTFGKVSNHLPLGMGHMKRDFPTCMDYEKFVNDGHLYYPNGVLNLNCEFNCFTDLPTVLEGIHHGSNVGTLKEFLGKVHDAEVSELRPAPMNSKETFQDSMYNLYKKGQLCDVILRAGGATFPCHKTVLCARSPVFRAMFENDMEERETREVDIEDVESRTLDVFLTYLYTDDVKYRDWEIVLKLLIVADKYDIPTLKQVCASILKTKVSFGNVCEVLTLADALHDQDLREFVKRFICKHSSQIIGSEKWDELMSTNPYLAANTMRDLVLERSKSKSKAIGQDR